MAFIKNMDSRGHYFKHVLISLISMKKFASEGKSIDNASFGLDYKVLAIIGGLIIAYQIGLFLTADDPGYNITDTVYLMVIGLAATFGIIVAKRYWGSEVFGRSYIFLAIGYLGMLGGDLAFYYYEYILEIDPYPSPFDVGFLIGYFFLSAHLAANVRFFQEKWKSSSKLILIAVPLLVTSVYIVAAYTEWGEYEELPFDIFWGSLFALGSSITLAFAIIGVTVFRKSVLKEVWLLLVAGIFLGMVADVWYYYLETFEAYYSSHVVNTMWVAAYMLVIYALIRHRKII